MINPINFLCFKVEPALPTWNEIYKSPHWSVRHRLEKQWLEIVRVNLIAHLRFNKISYDPNGATPLFGKDGEQVKITVCNYSSHPVDPDNVFDKVAIDAMKGIVISDDSAYVVGGGVHCFSFPLKKGIKSFSCICVERAATDKNWRETRKHQ